MYGRTVVRHTYLPRVNPVEPQKTSELKNLNRQQTKRVTFRLLPEAHDRLQKEAEAAGVSVSSLVKVKVFGESATVMKSAPRRPAPDIEELRRILGHLGQIGNNTNQIARKLNGGGEWTDQRALGRIQTDLNIMRQTILSTLGVSWDK